MSDRTGTTTKAKIKPSSDATHEVDVTVSNETFQGNWYLYVANASTYYSAAVNSWSITF